MYNLRAMDAYVCIYAGRSIDRSTATLGPLELGYVQAVLGQQRMFIHYIHTDIHIYMRVYALLGYTKYHTV